MITCIFLFICIIFGYWIYRKTILISDTFNVRKEIKYELILLLIFTFLYVIIEIIFVMININNMVNIKIEELLFVVLYELFVILMLCA